MKTGFSEPRDSSDPNAYGCHGGYRVNLRKNYRDHRIKRRYRHQGYTNNSYRNSKFPSAQIRQASTVRPCRSRLELVTVDLILSVRTDCPENRTTPFISLNRRQQKSYYT